MRLSREIKIHELFDEKIPIGIDDESLIGDLDGIHVYDRSHFEISFDPADKFQFLIGICVEIDAGALETDFLSVFGDERMRIIGELVIHGDPTGKREGRSQGIHSLRRELSEF